MPKPIRSKKYRITLGITLLLILLVAGIYLPGLSSTFMLDDWSNLPTLYESMKYHGFWYSILDGGSGPTGRPIALLTFALQQEAWQNPFPFKLVNLCIHLINTALVFWLAMLITPALNFVGENRRWLFAAIVALLWAALPIQVSTVLYVVQRMVLLSSTFTLLGVITYFYGRHYLANGNERAGYALITGGLGLFGLLALFSKETGFLLVLYLLCLELLFQEQQPINRRLFNTWIILCLITPVLLFLAYLATHVEGFLLGYEKRDFTLTERLLSQPRILWDYAFQTLFPRLSQLGLYHDGYVASRSLFAPPTTFWALAGLGVLLAIAVSLRKRWPLLSFCILWFLAGHSMESSIIPIELYFEHRNYLPSFGLVLGFVALITYIATHIRSKIIKRLFEGMTLLYLAGIMGLTLQQARLWGDPVSYALVQSHEHPESIRARSLMIGLLSRADRLDLAYEESKRLAKDFPTVSTALLDLEFACVDSRFPLPDINQLEMNLAVVRYDVASIKTISDTLDMVTDGRCQAINVGYLDRVIQALQHHAGYEKRASDLAIYRSLLYMHEGKIPDAINVLQVEQQLSYEGRMHLARLQASRGAHQAAIDTLDAAEQNLGNSIGSRIKREMLEELRNTIRADLSPSPNNSASQATTEPNHL